MRRSLPNWVLGVLAALAILGFAGTALGQIDPPSLPTQPQPAVGVTPQAPVPTALIQREGKQVCVEVGYSGMLEPATTSSGTIPGEKGRMQIELYNGYTRATPSGTDADSTLVTDSGNYDPGMPFGVFSVEIPEAGKTVAAHCLWLATEPPSGSTLIVYVDGGDPSSPSIVYTPSNRGGNTPRLSVPSTYKLPDLVIPAASSDGNTTNSQPVSASPPATNPVAAPQPKVNKPAKSGKTRLGKVQPGKAYVKYVKIHGKLVKLHLRRAQMYAKHNGKTTWWNITQIYTVKHKGGKPGWYFYHYGY